MVGLHELSIRVKGLTHVVREAGHRTRVGCLLRIYQLFTEEKKGEIEVVTPLALDISHSIHLAYILKELAPLFVECLPLHSQLHVSLHENRLNIH